MHKNTEPSWRQRQTSNLSISGQGPFLAGTPFSHQLRGHRCVRASCISLFYERCKVRCGVQSRRRIAHKTPTRDSDSFGIVRRHRTFSLDVPRTNEPLETGAVIMPLRREDAVGTPLVAERSSVAVERVDEAQAHAAAPAGIQDMDKQRSERKPDLCQQDPPKRKWRITTSRTCSSGIGAVASPCELESNHTTSSGQRTALRK